MRADCCAYARARYLFRVSGAMGRSLITLALVDSADIFAAARKQAARR